MKNLKGALLFAQSGGPTSVINSSACGVFEEAFKHSEITQVLGAAQQGRQLGLFVFLVHGFSFPFQPSC